MDGKGYPLWCVSLTCRRSTSWTSQPQAAYTTCSFPATLASQHQVYTAIWLQTTAPGCQASDARGSVHVRSCALTPQSRVSTSDNVPAWFGSTQTHRWRVSSPAPEGTGEKQQCTCLAAGGQDRALRLAFHAEQVALVAARGDALDQLHSESVGVT